MTEYITLTAASMRLKRRLKKLVGQHGEAFDVAYKRAYPEYFAKPKTESERGVAATLAILIAHRLEEEHTPNLNSEDVRRLVDELGPFDDDDPPDNRPQTAIAQPTGQGGDHYHDHA